MKNQINLFKQHSLIVKIYILLLMILPISSKYFFNLVASIMSIKIMNASVSINMSYYILLVIGIFAINNKDKVYATVFIIGLYLSLINNLLAFVFRMFVQVDFRFERVNLEGFVNLLAFQSLNIVMAIIGLLVLIKIYREDKLTKEHI